MALPDDMQLMILRCRGSRHLLLEELSVHATATVIMGVLWRTFKDDPLFHPKLIVADEDPRHTKDLKSILQHEMGVVLHTVEPNRHSNGSAEGTISWVRQVVGKRCLDVGGWQHFRVSIRQHLREMEEEVAATPQPYLRAAGVATWLTPDQFITLPESQQQDCIARRRAHCDQQCDQRELRTARLPDLPAAGRFLYWDPAVSDSKHPDRHLYTGPFEFGPCLQNPPHPNCRVRISSGRHCSTHRLKECRAQHGLVGSVGSNSLAGVSPGYVLPPVVTMESVPHDPIDLPGDIREVGDGGGFFPPANVISELCR
jgi:hypothetical protein